MIEIVIDILWKGLFWLVVIGIAQGVILLWIAVTVAEIWLAKRR